MFFTFFHADNEEKSKAVEKLIEQSTPRPEFFLFVALSTAMATLGILISSVPVIIGSMLIAPMLYPILAIAMGLSISDRKLIVRSGATLGQGIIVAIVSAVLVALFFIKRSDLTELDLIIRTNAALIDVGIAIVSGLAASFALTKKSMNESFSGVAIAAALVPPLAAVGISLVQFNLSLFQDTVVTLVISIVGIILTSLFVFVLFDFHNKKSLVRKTIETEDKTVKDAIKEASKIE